MVNNRHYILSVILSVCVLLETLALTYMQEHGAFFYYSSSIIYFLAGIAISVIPLIPIVGKSEPVVRGRVLRKGIPYLTSAFILFILGYQLAWLVPLYKNVTIDKRWADMLPSIQLACDRFLQGKTVYGPAPEIWPVSIIPYMPFMWIPFLPSVIFKFDLRWMTFTLQSVGIAFAFIPVFRRPKNVAFSSFIIALTGVFLFINYFAVKRTDYWSMTEEGVVAGLYMLLSFALLRRNYWLIGLGIMACCLSRYSLIFWLPVYFAYVFLTQPRSDFWKLALSFGLSICAFFMVPFFMRDPWYFFNIPSTYVRFNQRFWTTYKIDEHLLYNVGLFKFFTFKSSQLMSILEVILSFAAPAIFFLIVRWLKERYALNMRYVAYASLKISLIFFFGFIRMPYLYIFVPVTLMSYIVLFDYLASQTVNATQLIAE